MKTLKRLLLLVLALVMCLSLFACSDEPSNDEPSNDDPVIDNPDNGKEDEKDESGLTVVENDFIIDYQALEGGKFYIDYEGADPTEVLYGNSMANDTQLYAPYWEIVEGKLEIQLEGDMMGAKADKIIKFKTDTKSYITYLTVNPITENYFIADGTEASYKLAIADILSAKFNGEDVASVTGITKDATGLTFTKELLATKLGHNVVEIKTATKSYILSVCAVTKVQTERTITFEDGKMSPFVAVFGNDYQVVKVLEATTDQPVKDYYNQLYYAVGTAATKVKNTYALEVDHKAGSPEQLKIYISAFYLRERLESFKRIDGTMIPADKLNRWGTQAYNYFFNDSKYYITIRHTATEFPRYSGQADYWFNIGGGSDIAGAEYFWANKVQNNYRKLADVDMYDKMIDSNGNIIEHCMAIIYRDAESGGGHKIFVDDIGGYVNNQGSYGANLNVVALP